MLIKTHLAITVFFILLFIPAVNHDPIFVSVALIATFLPDLDSRYSTLGRKKLARVLQWFTKHRGLIHSFTFLIFMTFIFVFFIPVIAFGFFLGYGLHLVADSFTVYGIRPFYPSKNVLSGNLKTGAKVEKALFFSLIVVDVMVFVWRVSII
ncbi:MAG TPA: metal-dependent hydrolase [Candidatus Nanoarchaeia archaeon]|nr:metal-dependent hydrolase [Candidatus Nanoarchaeia archaeon]